MGFKVSLALFAGFFASNAWACKCIPEDESRSDIAYKALALFRADPIYRAKISVTKRKNASEAVKLDIEKVLRGTISKKAFTHQIQTSCDYSMASWNNSSLWIFGAQPNNSGCETNVLAPSPYVDRLINVLNSVPKDKLDAIEMPDKTSTLAAMEEKIAHLPSDAYVLSTYTQFYQDKSLVVWAPQASVRTQSKVGRCQDDISGTARVAPWRVSIMESAGSALFYTLKIPGPNGAKRFALPDPEQGRWKTLLDQGYTPPEELSAAIEEYAQATQIPARLEFRADLVDHANACKPASMMLEIHSDKITVLSSEYSFTDVARGKSQRAHLETWIPSQ
jgi:hypothetical protein